MRVAVAALLLALVVTPLSAQRAASSAPLKLSLRDAVAAADSASEAVGIARAGVAGARGRLRQAESGRLPQLSGSASYTRTLASQFSSFASDAPGAADTIAAPIDCARFTPRPGLPIGERLDSLERGLDCVANGGGGLDFGALPFGQANAWRFGLELQQTLFNRSLAATISGARAGEDQAEAAYRSARAGAILEVATGYLDAQLSERLLAIADSTLAQAERTYRDMARAGDVGNAAEFDVLRAQVARDNQRPIVAERRSARDVAMIRLRQLLDLPADQPLELVTSLDDTTTIPLPGFVADVPSDPDRRAPVRQAEAAFRAATAAHRAARDARWPTLALTSSYAQLAYPRDPLRFGTFLSDWTVGVQLSVPLFTGGRLAGSAAEAEANAVAARLRWQQTRELALSDDAEIESRLGAAELSYAASGATVASAERAYHIAELRLREGLSTLTDLAEVRLQLQQAEANRAQAARDLRLARLRYRLLGDLPLGTTGPTAF